MSSHGKSGHDGSSADSRRPKNSGPDETLHWQLRALRQEIRPEQDLWPGIATRLGDLPQASAAAATDRRIRRSTPWAIAASLLLALGMIWQIPPGSSDNRASNPLISQQAVAMSLEYEGAIAHLQQVATHPEMRGALGELDRSTAQILAAIERDPNATFLLEQLRRNYARRLQLTQRAIMT